MSHLELIEGAKRGDIVTVEAELRRADVDGTDEVSTTKRRYAKTTFFETHADMFAQLT